jgi:DNA-binding MarR family transcriptional regulator
MMTSTFQDPAGMAQLLMTALERLPGVKAAFVSATGLGDVPTRPKPEDLESDTLGVRIGAKQFDIKVISRSTLYPRDVRELLVRLEQSPPTDSSVVRLIAAHSISEGAKQILRDKQVGYFDSGGSLFIPAKSAYIFIEKPPPKAMAKAVGEVFTGRRTLVLQALLNDREKKFGVNDLAELTSLSPSTVSTTLKALEDFEWVSSEGKGPSKLRKLTDASALLDAWSKKLSEMPSQSVRRFYVPEAHDTANLVALICNIARQSGHKIEMTGEIAAQHYAPYLSRVSVVRCRMQTGPHTRLSNQTLRQLDAREVSSGANLEVIESHDEHDFTFTRDVDDVKLATPLQVYLDLLRDGSGRSKEQAEHLRRERLGF